MDNSYYVLKDMDPKLRKYGEAISEFGMKNVFHIEFFSVKGDDYIAIGYNNRRCRWFVDVYNFAHCRTSISSYAAIVAGERVLSVQDLEHRSIHLVVQCSLCLF